MSLFKSFLLNAARYILPAALCLGRLPSLSAQLKAGAARVDITPAAADLTQQFISISTPLFARSLVLDNHGQRVVIVVADLPTISTNILEDLTKRIAMESGAPIANVLVAVTHTHSSYRIDLNPAGGVLPQSAKVTEMTEDRMVDAVRQAIAKLQPARAGYATGVFHLGTFASSRISSEQPQAAVATLGVFEVENEAGEIMALLVNGGPEPVLGMSLKTRIGADVAGETERYIEQRFNDKVVALYTIGSPPSLVIDFRKTVAGAAPLDVDRLMSTVGTVLGEEALSTLSRIKTSSDVALSGAVQVLTCPGKVTKPLNNPASCSDAPDAKLPPCVFTDHDTAPVSLRIGVLHLGNLSIIDTDSNISPAVWAQVADHAPMPASTMLVALTYGPMHYVQPDAEYPSNSYPATATTAKRGCAEKGFVDDALTMLKSGDASLAQ